ncbi:uncharacterized protein LOC133201612 [Saccostrea echinata]|uniref:uncharacterized protein LOC133201612 n=1 Tax=Saccostrea echinata TaxID=191078 RepID=UPI002A802C7E|nr:uncharacterized protein LOC133201612 [Saccostrea echinata]
MTLNLKDLYSEEGNITDSIRSSRSKFMDWINETKMKTTVDSEKLRSSSSKKIEQPGSSSRVEIEQPGSSSRVEIEQPGNSSTVEIEQPGSSSTVEIEQPGSSSTVEIEQPGSSSTVEIEQPGSNSRMEIKQPGSSSIVEIKQPGSDSTMENEQTRSSLIMTEKYKSSSAEKKKPESNCSVSANDKPENGDDDGVRNKSVDKDVLKKLLFGSRIPVHLSNLISPSDESLVRSLDDEHLEKIYTQIKKSHGHYTTLIGVVKTEIENPEVLRNPNVAEIEIIGGNHTRKVLQRLLQEGILDDDYCALVDVYENLTTAQILHLGFMHNEIHESSRKMTFKEKVLLFRKLRFGVLAEEENTRKGAILWRGRVATVTNKTRNEVKNAYKVHLNLASQDKEVWECIEKVFQACKCGSVKGLKSSDELSQYDFLHFSKVKEVEERKQLLLKLAEGSIDVAEFRENTRKQRALKGKKSIATVEKTKTPEKTQASEFRETEEHFHTEEIREQEDSISESDEKRNLEEIEALKMKANDLREQLKNVKEKNRRMEEKLALNSKLLSEQEKEIESLRGKTKEQEKEILHLKKSEEYYQIEIQREKERRSLAEDAATRARAKLTEKPENKKTTKTTKEENKPETTSQKRKIFTKRPWDYESAESEDMKKLKQKDDKEENIQVNCGIVRYINDIYLGHFESAEKFVFCKAPITQFNYEEKTFKDIHITEKSVELNSRDCQQVLTEDVITSFKGSIDNKGKIVKSITENEIEKVMKSFLKL